MKLAEIRKDLFSSVTHGENIQSVQFLRRISGESQAV
jgi:hypothetical protein